MGLNLSTIGSAFNKSGYRLLSKKVENLATSDIPGAVKKSVSVIEHTSGSRKIVTSYLNNQGKSVLIRHQLQDETGIKLTFLGKYDWKRKFIKIWETSGIRGNLFFRQLFPQQKIFQKGTLIFRCINGKQKQSYFTQASVQSPIGDTIGVKQIRLKKVSGKGEKEITKTLKEAKASDSFCGEGDITCKNVELKDAEEIFSYPYLESLISSSKEELLRNAAEIAYKRQNVTPMNLRLNVETPRKVAGWCDYSANELAVTESGMKNTISYQLNTLEHEARHKYQHVMVDKLNKGELKSHDEIAFAQKSKDNFNKYYVLEDDFQKYYDQFVETDARAAGASVETLHKDFLGLLQKAFGNLRPKLNRFLD